jgi:hypothetical protein
MVAKPAIAQANPSLRWRLTSSFPKSLDTLYGISDTISKYVAEVIERTSALRRVVRSKPKAVNLALHQVGGYLWGTPAIHAALRQPAAHALNPKQTAPHRAKTLEGPAMLPGQPVKTPVQGHQRMQRD